MFRIPIAKYRLDHLKESHPGFLSVQNPNKPNLT